MRSGTTTLISALRILARDIQSNDGVANAAIAEAADRLDEIERKNAALRERLHNADAEIDMWAARCAAAIWMLPEQVTGGQLREAQDRFHRMLHAARKEAQP